MAALDLPDWWVEWQQQLAPHLQQSALVVHEQLVCMQEGIVARQTYGIPFYYVGSRRFAYLNQPRNADHLRICFIQGWRMAPLPKVLRGAQKAQVRYVRLDGALPLPDYVSALCHEAILIALSDSPERNPRQPRK